MDLLRTGYYREMHHAEESDPSIIDYVNKLSAQNELEHICNYLQSGIPLIVCCGVDTDIINPNRGVSGCPSMLTDGHYIWPGDLAYYVKEYALGIDENFIANMRNNNWTIPIKLEDIDFDNLYLNGKKLV